MTGSIASNVNGFFIIPVLVLLGIAGLTTLIATSITPVYCLVPL